MTLTVEDGSGVAGADSYCSVDFADAYLSARGYTLWATMTIEEKEQALRRSTDYIENTYSTRWIGSKTDDSQPLSWPRYGAAMKDAGYWQQSYWPGNAMPSMLLHATAMLAFKAASGDISPDISPPVASKTVGPISVTYQPGARQTAKYQAIDDTLAPLLSSGGAMLKLVRA